MARGLILYFDIDTGYYPGLHHGLAYLMGSVNAEWSSQDVARGAERMGWVNLAEVRVSEPHDAERDVAFFSGTASFIRVPAGSFAIFGPEDVHMPGVAPDDENASGVVRKIVVKVKG